VFADMTQLENPFGPRPKKPRPNWLSWAAALIAVVALGTNFWLYRDLTDATRHTSTLESQVAALQIQVAALQQSLATAQSSTDSSPALQDQPTVSGDLPRFSDASSDSAIGMTLGPITGIRYPDGETTTVDPADGVARAWLVWAHWCQYCQQELPIVKTWYEANAAVNPFMEIVSITTAIDDTAPNPLLPYLEAEQFPFPVLIDATGALSAQLGVSAFPFWVFTGPDGQVLGRSAGVLPADQLADYFEQLNGIGAEG
jgi:thiol-disulfide isomerase/thioredoxin